MCYKMGQTGDMSGQKKALKKEITTLLLLLRNKSSAPIKGAVFIWKKEVLSCYVTRPMD